MPENERQFKTGTVINYKSQCTAARYLRYYGIFNEKLLQISCWVSLWKNFKISQHLAKLQARKLFASRAQCVWALSCWKMKNSTHQISRVWQETAVVSCFNIDFNLA